MQKRPKMKKEPKIEKMAQKWKKMAKNEKLQKNKIYSWSPPMMSNDQKIAETPPQQAWREGLSENRLKISPK